QSAAVRSSLLSTEYLEATDHVRCRRACAPINDRRTLVGRRLIESGGPCAWVDVNDDLKLRRMPFLIYECRWGSTHRILDRPEAVATPRNADVPDQSLENGIFRVWLAMETRND